MHGLSPTWKHLVSVFSYRFVSPFLLLRSLYKRHLLTGHWYQLLAWSNIPLEAHKQLNTVKKLIWKCWNNFTEFMQSAIYQHRFTNVSTNVQQSRTRTAYVISLHMCFVHLNPSSAIQESRISLFLPQQYTMSSFGVTWIHTDIFSSCCFCRNGAWCFGHGSHILLAISASLCASLAKQIQTVLSLLLQSLRIPQLLPARITIHLL